MHDTARGDFVSTLTVLNLNFVCWPSAGPQDIKLKCNVIDMSAAPAAILLWLTSLGLLWVQVDVMSTLGIYRPITNTATLPSWGSKLCMPRIMGYKTFAYMELTGVEAFDMVKAEPGRCQWWA